MLFMNDSANAEQGKNFQQMKENKCRMEQVLVAAFS
jgi:hypothetical protein